MFTTSFIFISCSLACHKLMYSCVRSGFFYSHYFSTIQKNDKNNFGKETISIKTVLIFAPLQHIQISPKSLQLPKLWRKMSDLLLHFPCLLS